MTEPRPAFAYLGALLVAFSLPLVGCKGKGSQGVALAKAEQTDEFANVPVPPENGPKLYAVQIGAVVYEKPSASSKKLGELRVGGPVSRSKDAVTRKDCEAGWYAVRPKGFVCAGPLVAVDPGAPARGLPAPPDLTKALPYRYGRARSENVPLYARLPTPAEQLAAEPDLKKILGKGEDLEPLGAAANDVPLDARGIATGIPVLQPTGEGVEANKRTAASFFGFPQPALPPWNVLVAEPKTGALRKSTGIALAGSLTVDGEAAPRRFAVTADGRLVPTDRLKPALGTTWHGLDLDKVGLPVAFIHKAGVHTWTLKKAKASKNDDELERRAAVPLTGKFRTVDGMRFEETRDGQWLRSQDLVVVVKRSKFPDFVRAQKKWLDVSIAQQTMTVYEGTKPLYVTLISAGRDQLKDPATSAATPLGSFPIQAKHVTRGLDSKEVQGSFDVNDAPYVMELEGASVHGTYWGDGIGEAQTFHNVFLAPIDAHRIWTWADPQVPEGWSTIVGGGDDATMVHIRK